MHALDINQMEFLNSTNSQINQYTLLVRSFWWSVVNDWMLYCIQHKYCCRTYTYSAETHANFNLRRRNNVLGESFIKLWVTKNLVQQISRPLQIIIGTAYCQSKGWHSWYLASVSLLLGNCQRAELREQKQKLSHMPSAYASQYQ